MSPKYARSGMKQEHHEADETPRMIDGVQGLVPPTVLEL